MNVLCSIFGLLFVVLLIQDIKCLSKRCFQCRSRGELGSCRDPFPFNVTQAEDKLGLGVVACASGWCGKIIESGSPFKEDDYGVATERKCLQRGPSDDQERCADVIRNHKRVYMCFCNGDMCNSGKSITSVPFLVGILGIFASLWRFILL